MFLTDWSNKPAVDHTVYKVVHFADPLDVNLQQLNALDFSGPDFFRQNVCRIE